MMKLSTAAFGLAAVGALTTGTATRAAAQANPDSVRARVSCERAARIVRLGHPARKDDWAWSIISRCGRLASAAVASAWSAQATVSDTSQLRAVYYSPLYALRDSALFEAAAAVAADAKATPESRAYSVMLMQVQLFARDDPDYADYVDTGPYDVCRGAGTEDRGLSVGTPLPADAPSQARSIARALENDPSAPPAVQSAGRCLDQRFALEERVRALPPRP